VACPKPGPERSVAIFERFANEAPNADAWISNVLADLRVLVYEIWEPNTGFRSPVIAVAAELASFEET